MVTARCVLVAVVLGSFLFAPTDAGAQETDRNQNASEVNVEIILDVSGSMAQTLDSGESRMEAAQRVLGDVVRAIPQREGINVGLRVYGHEGDNSNEGRNLSCDSTELLVPLQGVREQELLQQINALEPTGWTPIGLALEQAQQDFVDDSENVTNAVIVVTDGLETCDGDPAAAANELRTGQSQTTTHLIGFALTPEEQETLSQISEEGGGLLLEASDASELNDALYSVFDQLDIVLGVGYVGGNAFSLLPAGEEGELSVISVGQYDGNTLPFVIRNNTAEDVLRTGGAVVGRDSDGALIATGSVLSFNPNYLQAGEVGFGYAYFQAVPLPGDTEFEFDLNSTPVSQATSENIRDLIVVEASQLDGRIVGTLRNDHEETLVGPFGANIACFDESGELLDVGGNYPEADELAPNETIPFQIVANCPAFLLAGTGFGPFFGPVPEGPESSGTTSASPSVTPEPVSSTDERASSPSDQPTDSASQPVVTLATVVNLGDRSCEPGEVTIEADVTTSIVVSNGGSDSHTFGIDELQVSFEVPAGETRAVSVTPASGEYTYFCNGPDDDSSGMNGTLLVE